MATEILAINTTAANSADVTIADGEQLTVCLKDDVGPVVGGAAKVKIQLKDDSAEYFTVATLYGYKPALVLIGAGTYRFSRSAGTSCGVFSA